MRNGTCIGQFSYKRRYQSHQVGSLFYFRSNDAKVRLSTFPVWAIAKEVWMHAEFLPALKVEEAPLIDGDLIGADGNVVGHMTCDQSKGDGEDTTYSMVLWAMDIKSLIKAHLKAEEDPDKAAVWLKVRMV